MGGVATAVSPQGTAGDETLVAAVRRGDDRAFEELYHRYHPRIAAYVRGMVRDNARAEDVTQEVFFSSLRRMRDTERAIAFKPWVYEIARNACIDQFRRGQRSQELSLAASDGFSSADHIRLVSSEPTPDAAADVKQRLDDLCGAFGGLSANHHEILVLRELEGLSYREIGERMGMTRPAVESTLFRARRRLAEEYDELASGRRCLRVQAALDSEPVSESGLRDRRRLVRHLSHCQPCRRHARSLGIATPERSTGIGARLAGILPIPLWIRGRAPAGAASGQSASSLATWSGALAVGGEPVTNFWGKAVAVIAALGLAGTGAGVATHQISVPLLRDLPYIGALAGGGAASPHEKAGVPGSAAAGPSSTGTARQGATPTSAATTTPTTGAGRPRSVGSVAGRIATGLDPSASPAAPNTPQTANGLPGIDPPQAPPVQVPQPSQPDPPAVPRVGVPPIPAPRPPDVPTVTPPRIQAPDTSAVTGARTDPAGAAPQAPALPG